jgi:hypothetical protein
MKKSFILHIDQKEVFDTLTNEQAGVLIKAIFNYEFDKTLIELEPLLKIIFIPIRQAIDRNTERYDNVCKRNSENISKRWNKENTKNTSRKSGIKKIPRDTRNTDNDNDNDSDNDSERGKSAEAQPTQKNFRQLTEKEFYDEVAKYSNQFAKELLRSFYNHWSEKSPKGKMKFQLEETWELKKRLDKWKATDERFNKKNGIRTDTTEVFHPALKNQL